MMNQVKRIPIQVRVPIISDKQNCCSFEEPFGYIGEVTLSLGYNRDMISKACKSNNYEYKGFIWKFKEETTNENSSNCRLARS